MNPVRQNAALFIVILTSCSATADPSDPDLIFSKSTTFKLLTPNDKLAVYGIDDPLVEGVACHYTAPEKGGLSGALGWPNRRRTFRSRVDNMVQSSSKEPLARVMSSSASAARLFLKRCKS
jgi:CreA protein